VSADMFRHAEVLRLLDGILTDAMVADLARGVLGDPAATVDRWWIDPVDYQFGTPITKGAVRVRGVAADARSWSVFVKVVQAFRHWPMIDIMPPSLRQGALDTPLWRYEADLYTSRASELLPAGLRLPALHAVLDLGDDRIGIIVEDVAIADVSWDDGRFAQAARLLARMAVRLTKGDALPASGSRVPGGLSRLLYEGSLQTAVLPALADDRTWAHPLLTAWQDTLQRDLAELASRIPALLEHLNRLPQLMVHGDASPQNLLIPAGEPDTIVAIDWSLGELAAAGHDLAQLLIGLAHAGQLPVADLARVRDIIIDAYLEGLAEEGYACDREQVAHGLDGALAIRSAFTALPLDRLNEPSTNELDNLLRNRLQLTRYLCDLGLAMPLAPGMPN
jgi:hypothetical protein